MAVNRVLAAQQQLSSWFVKWKPDFYKKKI